MGGESNANVSPELNLQFSISFIETEKTMTNAYGMFHLLYEHFFYYVVVTDYSLGMPSC